MSPEARLERAGLIVRSVRNMGGNVALVGGAVVIKSPGRPLLEQLDMFYRREAAAILASEAIVRMQDHV